MNTLPTPDAALNAVLAELVTSAHSILGGNFLGAYLQGSFAVGDWDEHSDVDFTIAVRRPVSEAELDALQAMHARIYHLPPHWAQHLEGSYFPAQVLKSIERVKEPLLFLDNTHQQLEWSGHDNTLVVRWMLRERGILLAGPPPQALVDPVPPGDLRREVRETMDTWAQEILAGRYSLSNRWAQPFAVLMYCRMLHTLATGRVESKLAGARWAKEALDPRWSSLIERAWAQRPDPSLKVRQPADPAELEATLEFIRYALDRGAHFSPATAPNARRQESRSSPKDSSRKR